MSWLHVGMDRRGSTIWEVGYTILVDDGIVVKGVEDTEVIYE